MRRGALQRPGLLLPILALLATLAPVAGEANVFHRSTWTSGPAPALDFFRPLDPQAARAEERVLSAVGVIRCPSTGGIASGFLVSVAGQQVDVIVGTAHTFRDQEGRAVADCVFHPGGPDGPAVPIAHVEVGNEDPYNRYDFFGNNGRHDWAVGVLARRVGHRYGALPFATIADAALLEELIAAGANFRIVGYHPDYRRLMVAENCRPYFKSSGFRRSRVREELAHDCNAGDGFSGAPILIQFDGRYGPVCIHSNSFNQSRHRPGEPFDPGFNPNQCVRLEGKVVDVIQRLATGGAR